MDMIKNEPTKNCHVVAMAYPGRGHINPMMNLCKSLSIQNPNIKITFVVTEEWLGLLGPDCAKPFNNITFATLPNVIPSEKGRAKDFAGFIEAVWTKMVVPFEELLDRLEQPVSAIVADSYVGWTVGVGRKRKVPVASLFPMSASVFNLFIHFDLVKKHGHFPLDVLERGEEVVDYIPGLLPTRIADFPTVFFGPGRQTLQFALESASGALKADYLLFTSAYELEPEVFDALKLESPCPVYTVGPAIPYFDLVHGAGDSDQNVVPDYFKWLDSQPEGSVLYVSLGSFLSVSPSQMDEIVAGVGNSGVRFLWVARTENANWFRGGFGGDNVGMVVPWCDQLRVLCHPSVGGFWSHCGWNSTLEAAFAGVPMLTFPIFWDQFPDSKRIVDDWKIGWRVRRGINDIDRLVTRDEMAKTLKLFMDPGNNEARELRRRARALRDVCRGLIAEGGSSHNNLCSFIRDISRSV